MATSHVKINPHFKGVLRDSGYNPRRLETGQSPEKEIPCKKTQGLARKRFCGKICGHRPTVDLYLSKMLILEELCYPSCYEAFVSHRTSCVLDLPFSAVGGAVLQ